MTRGGHTLEQVCRRLRHRQLWTAYRAWCKVVSDDQRAHTQRKHNAIIMNRCLQRMINAQLAAAWRQWSQHLHRLNAGQRAARMLHRVACHWRAGTLRLGWHALVRNVHASVLADAHAQRHGTVMNRCLQRALNARVGAAWQQWQWYVRWCASEEQRRDHQARVVGMVTRRMRFRALWGGWSTWVRWTEAERGAETRVQMATSLVVCCSKSHSCVLDA